MTTKANVPRQSLRNRSPTVKFLSREWFLKVHNRTLVRLRLNEPPPTLRRGTEQDLDIQRRVAVSSERRIPRPLSQRRGVCVCVSERVCVCERERDRASERDRERKRASERERKRESAREPVASTGCFAHSAATAGCKDKSISTICTRILSIALEPDRNFTLNSK